MQQKMNSVEVEIRYGHPVVTSKNVFDVLENMGLRRWQRLADPMNLEEYMRKDLTKEEKDDLRFAPKAEVVFLEQPNGKPFTGFRKVGKSWATVWTMLPGDLIPIVAEFKHGIEEIVLTPPSGVPTKAESQIADPIERFMACGAREYEEETGYRLEKITPLSSSEGVSASSRQDTDRYYPFLGQLAEPIIPGPSKLDATEHLKLVLIPLSDWIELIGAGKVLDQCPHSITLLALKQLGRLRIM